MSVTVAANIRMSGAITAVARRVPTVGIKRSRVADSQRYLVQDISAGLINATSSSPA
jgi:hypothetical protein